MTRTNFILIMLDKTKETTDNNKFYELPAIALLKTTLVPCKNSAGERRNIQGKEK